jgi:hypothetical protein
MVSLTVELMVGSLDESLAADWVASSVDKLVDLMEQQKDFLRADKMEIN